jgi:hypothetical protein
MLFILAGLVGMNSAQTRPDASAAEKIRLMQEGQAKLTEATILAENHAKGKALEARCTVEPMRTEERSGAGMGVAEERGDHVRGRAPEGTARLVYTIQVFANDQVREVRVDGLERKIIEPGTGNRP